MVNRFTVNNVTYTAKPFDFGMICDLESVGVSIAEADKKGMSLIRGYFAICADLDKDDAAKEIQDHMIKGGTLDDITNAMTKEMNDSDFFRAMAKKSQSGEETNVGTSETEKPKRGRKPTQTVTTDEE